MASLVAFALCLRSWCWSFQEFRIHADDGHQEQTKPKLVTSLTVVRVLPACVCPCLNALSSRLLGAQGTAPGQPPAALLSSDGQDLHGLFCYGSDIPLVCGLRSGCPVLKQRSPLPCWGVF